MLNRIPWIKYAPELRFELQQCLDEGRDAEIYRGECEKILACGSDEHENISDLGVAGKKTKRLSLQREKQAIALGGRMTSAPMRPDYPYREPSEIKEILREADGSGQALAISSSKEELADRIKGAWTGRIAGCLLGKPVEGCCYSVLTRFLKKNKLYPLDSYLSLEGAMSDFSPGDLPWEPRFRCGWIDTVDGSSPPDDDTDYTILALKLVRDFGRNFTPDDVLENWLGSIPFLAVCTAERFAYRNACLGLTPPETALHLNPFREWIGAQIRADFYGYINPGDTRAAADAAWRDACISHTKNGIYGAMWVAAMHAACFSLDNSTKIIRAGLGEIPSASRLHEDIEKVISMHFAGKSHEQVIQAITAQYPDTYWVHTNPNAMIVAAALLFGEGDFSKTVCLAVAGGYDTDCNGATAGSLAGMRSGFSAIPHVWYEKNRNRVQNRIFGFGNPCSAEFLTSETLRLLNIQPEIPPLSGD